MEALRERFGKYHVLEKIAQGGMAEVYKVKTVGIAGFEKIQALKRILPHQAREARFIRSFIDEARIAGELTHRNIVQVFDFGKADGELFLAMELIEGKDLRTTIAAAVERDALPPVPIAAYILSEIAAGLEYAHRKADGYGGPLGIVHCDISPSNVMLSSEGDIKILDFGIARATFSSALERRRLRGKPRYMAPEQTVGEVPTAASDVFALGIIAWELLTGLPLYRGTDQQAILEAVRQLTPPRVDRFNQGAPREIVDAVARALAREPAQRGTAADLAAACARTAMQTGPRALAKWLASLAARPDDTKAVEGTAFDAPPGGEPAREAIALPAPAARRTETLSLADLASPIVDVPIEGLSAAPQAAAPEPLPQARWQALREPTEVLFGHPGPAPIEDSEDSDLGEPFEHTEHTAVSDQAPPLAAFDPSELTATAHSAVADVASEDTSCDELDPELGDAPIDDELGFVPAGELAERRRIVVVAGALSGGPPDVLRPVAKSLGELAYQRGGVVLELLPDALVVAFGLEIAGEDDVAIAMGWALDAAAMARDSAERLAIQLRIGACAGVTAASSSSPGPASSGGAVAPSVTRIRAPEGPPRIPPEAIADARALARQAAPDRPLFVGGAGRLTSRLYALRELPASGPPVPGGPVIEVVGPRGFDERDRDRLERRGKLIGRAAQLAELEAWLERARAENRRRCVLITGAAGTGKSRLAAELIARGGRSLRVITTAASPAGRLAPFATVIDLYQAALGLSPARGRGARAQVARRLYHVLTTAGVPPERAREITADLDRAMELRDGIGVATREPADLRPRISAGLAAFRAVLASRDRPALTVIEDVHLADRASVEVLRHALEVPARGAELLVITARPDGAPPPAVDAVIALGDFTGGDLRALIQDRLGEAATTTAIAAVASRSGGNPLFVEELAQAVRDAGTADIPASARDVVSARIDRLSPRARTALRFAAALGGTLRVRLLEELVGEASLDRELDELVAAGLLVRPDSAARASEGELSFARGLVREVVYESLSARAQRELHGRIGRLLASRSFAGREEPPAAIADHLERGGEAIGAAAFWLRAGRLAQSASDGDAAIACFTRTLELERALGPVPPTATSRARRREALAGREEAHRLQGDLASDPGDLGELEQLCAGEPARLADVAIRRALRLLRVGEHAEAGVATRVAEHHALAAGDERLRGEALRVRGEILERLGQFDEALAQVSVAREVFHRQGHVAGEMAAMVGCGRIHLLRSDYEAARDAYRPVLALIERTGDPSLEHIVASHVAMIELCLGDFAAAMRSAQRSLELCRRYSDRSREGEALGVAGAVLLEVGLHEQAAVMLADALDILARTHARWSHTECLIRAGICEQRRGRTGGLRMLDDALAEARRLGARYLEARALIARAGAHLRTGALSAAIADASAGASVARNATLVGHEIQGLARHALALSQFGHRVAEASALADRALALLEAQHYLEGSEEEVLGACAAVLDAAGVRDRAGALRERARASALRKLAGLPDPRWRAAYAAIPEIAGLLG